MSGHSPEKETPLVSVITPSYNAMPYLKETIESIRSQNYPAIEHIIMDGNSTDGTQELLQQYPNIIWVSEPDRGQSHALNKGFRRAKGEIIGWLNADDTYEPGAISKAVEFLETHRDVDLIYSNLRIIDGNSTPVGITRGQTFLLETLIVDNYIKQPPVFMRRRILDTLNGVDESLHYVMDWELWLRVGVAGFKIHYLENQAFANFRLIPGTKSFEEAPLFREEWLCVLNDAFKTPAFAYIPASIKNHALQKNKARYHVAHMMMAMESKDRRSFFYHFWRAAKEDPTLLANRGSWFFMYKAVLGQDIDRLRKFKKNLTAQSNR